MIRPLDRLAPFAMLLVLAGCAKTSTSSATIEAGGVDSPQTASLRGRIVWLDEALRRLHGIESDADAAHTAVALETSDGHLYPIVRDARGRGFLKDPRLHEYDYELFVQRYPGTDQVQVIRVYTLHDGQKFELDYWCDICSIPMFELKECECCQGPTRIREQPVEPDGP